MMHPLLSLYAPGSALKAMSRSGASRSVAGDSGSRVTYLSPATMVVSVLPTCWTKWWTLPLRVRWSKLVMSSGSFSGGSGSTNRGSLSGLAAWECQVVMSDLLGLGVWVPASGLNGDFHGPGSGSWIRYDGGEFQRANQRCPTCCTQSAPLLLLQGWHINCTLGNSYVPFALPGRIRSSVRSSNRNSVLHPAHWPFCVTYRTSLISLLSFADTFFPIIGRYPK